MAKRTRVDAPVPVWTNGSKSRERRRERQERLSKTRPWMMHYDLAYDGGGSAFDQFYRTKFGAHWSAFWHLNFRSWGGSAELYFMIDNVGRRDALMEDDNQHICFSGCRCGGKGRS